MGKKLTVQLAAASLIFSACAAPAFADTFFIRPTDAPPSITEKTSFDLDETPYIYVHLPKPGAHVVIGFWQSPGGSFFVTQTPPFSTELNHWFSLNDAVDSSSHHAINQAGKWNVGATFAYSDPSFARGGGETSFTVTPEPVSSALFLTGGLALIAGHRRRKKSEILSERS